MMAGFDGPSLWLTSLHTHNTSPAPDLILNLTASCPLFFCFSQSPVILWISSSCCLPGTLTHTGPRVHLLAQLTWWRGLRNFPEQPREQAELLKLLFFLQHLLCCRKLSHLRTRSKLTTLGTGQVMREPKKILRANYEWLNGRHPEVPCSQCASEPLKPNYPVWSPSGRNGYESWVVIKDSFRCRDSE